jgi:hypothetical protein
MNVRVFVLFKLADEEALSSMRTMAMALTDNPASIRVFTDERPDRLVAEFTMPTEAQYKAVSKIDRALRLEVWRRHDTTIQFPKSEAEQARAKRKAERRGARRRGGGPIE